MTHDVKVLVVDDNQTIRDLVQYTLRNSGYGALTASSGEEALAVFKAHSAHIKCLITACQMPGMNGRELAERLLALQTDLGVIFMSGNTSGLRGYPLLTKPFSPDQLRTCISHVMRNVISKGIGLRRERSGSSAARFHRKDVNSLTPREAEILALLAQGYSTRRAAASLGIAFKTAECHRSRIYNKLAVHGIVGLVHYAIRNGIVEP